ncbi:IclR family transcriptional regulator [Anaerotruncus rubiinfantis]|uniref:IclR family transcriptional regulator n=1 Tax=Anaerotruncus rubiinfantis TaxID=1720200 RepID=UPI0018973714|nr:IclR family transcriptional regulator [Anaerotruncus rubiinfantis]
MENQSPVQSLDRAFDLIERLSLNPDGMLLMELSTASGLHKSTVHRLLSALISLGYVRKDESSNRYRLTLKLFELSGRVVDNIDVLEIAKPHIEQLRNHTQEAIHLVVREGADIVYIHKAESKQSSIRMFSRIGMRRPMYCTAVGKSIMATMTDDEVIRIWEKSDVKPYTEHTIVDLGSLFRELDTIRRCGYALDNEENELGVRCIGAAILDYTGRGRAALSISAPLARMTDTRVEELSAEILATRTAISTELGYKF